MNYIRSVWQLEDKFRVIAILVLAATVLVLSVMDIRADAAQSHDHAAGQATHSHAN